MLVLAVFSALMLSGCGASVTVSSYTQNGVRYNSYTVELDEALVTRMESSAAVNADGERYTVHRYLYELFAGSNGLGCEIVDSRYRDGAYVATYRRAFYGEPQQLTEPAAFVKRSYLCDISTQLDYNAKVLSQNPFTRRISRTSPDPFNGVRAAYDSVEPSQSGTVIQRLKNGTFSTDADTGERIVYVPALGDAFPYLRGIEPDGILLNYATVGAKRMDSLGSASAIDRDHSEYVFSRYFDDTERTIGFEYTRPVTYGWYIVALAVGGLVVAVFVLATRQKHQGPTLLSERFPYNPEEYRDYESRLPRAR